MSDQTAQAHWYHFLFTFLGGVFLINMLPHYIKRIPGEEFPTPFANSPNVVLSSPQSNVLWATIVFLISLSFCCFGKLGQRNQRIYISATIEVILMSFYLAGYFGG